MPEKQLLWDITGQCNLFCQHCYAYDKYEWRNKERIQRSDMTLEESKRFLSQAKAMGFNHVHLLGGEPLLRADVLDILTFARQDLDLKITMNTNGLLLTPRMIDSLIDLEIYQVAVSFEGTTAQTHDAIRGSGTFERTRKNLKKLGDCVIARGADMLVGVGYVITHAGLSDVKNVFQFALDNSANGLTVDFISKDGRAVEFFEELDYPEENAITALEELMESASGRVPPGFVFQLNVKPRLRRYLSERYGVLLKGEAFGDLCPAGNHAMLVENDGVTTPCGILNKKRKNEQAVSEGRYTPDQLHIKDFSSFEELQETSFFRSFSEFKKQHQGTVPTCQTCEFRASCQPCPIDWLDAKEVRECVIAEERRECWHSSVWNQPLSVNWPNLSSLNGIGCKIVEALQKQHTLAKISHDIAVSTGVTQAQVEEDVWDFAMSLRAAGLLSIPCSERR
jgi:MoaA/NifB/PqqE/SkfB family radical SAM enzyme